jgi:hypothetical protein
VRLLAEECNVDTLCWVRAQNTPHDPGEEPDRDQKQRDEGISFSTHCFSEPVALLGCVTHVGGVLIPELVVDG